MITGNILEATAAKQDTTLQILHPEERVVHARNLGIAPELIQVRTADEARVTITIGKADGRSMRRAVPKASWEDPKYRCSLIRDMGVMLA